MLTGDIRIVVPVPLEARKRLRELSRNRGLALTQMVRYMIGSSLQRLGETIPAGLLEHGAGAGRYDGQARLIRDLGLELQGIEHGN